MTYAPYRMPRTPLTSGGDTTLFSAYLQGDIGRIYHDRLRRPDHYSEEQRELLDRLDSGVVGVGAIPVHEINDLVLTYFRPTEVAQATQDAVSRARAKLDGMGRQSGFVPAVYEHQETATDASDPGDKTII